MAASTIAAGRTLISSGIAASRPRGIAASPARTVSSIACVQRGRFLGDCVVPTRTQVPNTLTTGTNSSRRRSWTVCGGSGTRAMSMATEAKGVIKVGEKLPEAELAYLDKDSNVQTVKISELTSGKKVVLFAVPGAFTPTCTQKHVPGFISKADELKAKGVDTIACVSVNDVFVLNAWGQSLGVGDKVLMLSDGNVTFTKALGVQMDLSDKPIGLNVRSRRYALLAEDGVVKQLNLEEGGAFSVSGPDEILKTL